MKELDLVKFYQFGVCPMCWNKMMLLKSNYKAYHLSSAGWITNMEDEKTDFEIVCTKCGLHHKMMITDKGLTPIELVTEDDTRLAILSDNPIGRKESDD